MKSLAQRFTAMLFSLFATAQIAAAIDVTPYAWQFPRVTGVSSTANDMIVQLQEEIQKVLDTGSLAPLRTYYADQGANEEYWQYTEPGRVITTLAWAYPYLTPTQQTAVRTYVGQQLASGTHAPWAGRLSPTAGARRELHPLERVTYFTTAFGTTRPTVQTIYGLWLYGYRSGDWTTIQNNWNSIRSMYSARAAQGDVYGTMGAHVAMVRMAERFSDTATRATALANLQTNLDSGVNFTTIETRVSTKYWAEMYDARRATLVYEGWMFLDLTPEIGRYLNDFVNSATITRHSAGKSLFPLWWLRRAPYFTRWTGDEGIGTPTEIIGMMLPIERWVVQANAATLRDYVRSGPTGVGDSYWLEALVQAIEATGTMTWVDVRNGDSTPPAPPTNFGVVP